MSRSRMDGNNESAAVEVDWRIGDEWPFPGQSIRVDDSNWQGRLNSRPNGPYLHVNADW